MNTPYHFLIGPAKPQGEIMYLGQNLMLSDSGGATSRFAAIIYAALGIQADAPAAALLIKATFSSPMMPLISPGHRLWDEFVQPNIDLMLRTIRNLECNSKTPRLGGIATQLAQLVKHQPRMLQGGGCILLPELPLAENAHAPMPQRAYPALQLIHSSRGISSPRLMRRLPMPRPLRIAA